jgi:hypothetical protein
MLQHQKARRGNNLSLRKKIFCALLFFHISQDPMEWIEIDHILGKGALSLHC